MKNNTTYLEISDTSINIHLFYLLMGTFLGMFQKFLKPYYVFMTILIHLSQWSALIGAILVSMDYNHKIIMDWVNYKQLKHIPHFFGHWESKIQTQAGLGGTAEFHRLVFRWHLLTHCPPLVERLGALRRLLVRVPPSFPNQSKGLIS